MQSLWEVFTSLFIKQLLKIVSFFGDIYDKDFLSSSLDRVDEDDKHIYMHIFPPLYHKSIWGPGPPEGGL